MSFLLQLAEFVLLSIVTLDTLGFIAELRKNSAKTDKRDYVRVCFTWVFLLALRSLACGLCCCGYFGGLFKMLFFGGKVYVSVPAIGGTETLYNLLVEQNVLKEYFTQAVQLVNSKVSCSQQ
jgi:hypothetical protein